MNKLVCDISHWQGATNFSTMQRAGVSAVIIKATEHISWLDVNFERNWQAAASVGLPWAPYHYYRPNYNPIQQAHWFAEKSHFVACDFAPVYDVEEPSGIPAGYASKLLTSLVNDPNFLHLDLMIKPRTFFSRFEFSKVSYTTTSSVLVIVCCLWPHGWSPGPYQNSFSPNLFPSYSAS